jgi:hypothetical protein
MAATPLGHHGDKVTEGKSTGILAQGNFACFFAHSFAHSFAQCCDILLNYLFLFFANSFAHSFAHFCNVLLTL